MDSFPSSIIDKLSALGYTSQVNDSLKQFLVSNGYDGSLHDALYNYLAAKPYSGSLAEKIYQWSLNNWPMIPPPVIVTPIADLTNSTGNGPWVINYSAAYTGATSVQLVSAPTGVTIDTNAQTITIPDAVINSQIVVGVSNSGGTVFDTFDVVITLTNTAPTATGGTVTVIVPVGTAPTIASSSPADDATGISVTTNPTITFNQNVLLAASGSFTIRNVTDSTDFEVFDLATEVGTGAGQISVSGAVVTLHITSNLANSKSYSIHWSSGAVTNLGGIGIAALTDDTTLNFTTVAGASTTSRTGYSFYESSADTSAERNGSAVPVTISGSDANNIVVGLFAIGKNASSDTFTFSAVKLTNGTTDLSPDVTPTIYDNTFERRVAAVAYWKDVPSGTWWIKFTPGATIRYASFYTGAYKDRNVGQTPVVSGGVSSSTSTTTTSSVTTTANNMMVAAVTIMKADTGSPTPVVSSGDTTQIATKDSGSAVGDVASVYSDGIKATAGASSTVVTWTGGAHNGKALVAF